jgi:hypothetical protein
VAGRQAAAMKGDVPGGIRGRPGWHLGCPLRRSRSARSGGDVSQSDGGGAPGDSETARPARLPRPPGRTGRGNTLGPRLSVLEERQPPCEAATRGRGDRLPSGHPGHSRRGRTVRRPRGAPVREPPGRLLPAAGAYAPAASGSSGRSLPDGADHLLRIGVPARLLLGEDEPPVGDDFEHAAPGFDELDLGVLESLFEPGRQPGGSGPVVSDGAVLDGDSHRRSPF